MNSSPSQVAVALQAKTFWDLEIAVDLVNLTVFNPADPPPNLLAPIAGIHNAPHAFNMGDWTGPSWYVHSGILYKFSFFDAYLYSVRLFGTEWFPSGVVAPNDPMFWPHHTVYRPIIRMSNRETNSSL